MTAASTDADSTRISLSRGLSSEKKARMRRFRRKRLLESLFFPMPFVVLIFAWYLATEVFGVSDQVLPSPAQVVDSARTLIDIGVLPEYTAQSVLRLAWGATLAIAIGVPLGLLLGANKYGERMFGPFLRFFQAVSGIAILPLVLVWFGFTEATIQFAILYSALTPVIFNTMIGVQTVPTIYRDALNTMGASRWKMIRDVYLPGSLASTVVGIRLGIGYGWRALIAGEMIVGAGGLGFLIFDARTFHQLGTILVGMIITGVLYVAIDRLILAPVEESVEQWGMQQS